MNSKSKLTAYGKLCGLFYDATKKYAPEKEVAFYASFSEQNQGRILEAMSGSGRLLIPLLQRGYLVDGVDNSHIMLDRCRERCAEQQLTPELYEQSLEQLNLPYKYTMVTIAVGSFQLIVERTAALQALKNLRAHMCAGGSLLIDFFVPDFTEERSTRIERIDTHTAIRLTTRYVFYQEHKRADAFCFYELVVDGIVKEQEDELLEITWYEDQELKLLLQEAGFAVIKAYEVSLRAAGPSHIIHARAL